jgi:nucleotide-binding universal stress UspA family protein
MSVTETRPSPSGAEPRYATLLAGYDASERAADGLALARLLAAATGARLVVAAVVPHEFPYAPGTAGREEAFRREAGEMLARAVPADGGIQTQVVGARSAAHGLHDLAQSVRADALIVGSSHRGPIGRLFAGSVAERLLYGAPCPVAVAPAGFHERSGPSLKVIACAFNGTDESRAALRHAVFLARAAGASLRLLSVHEPELIFGIDAVPAGYDPDEVARDTRAQLEHDLAEAASAVGPGLDVHHYVLEGSAHEALASAAENGVDLLVVGSRQYGPARRVLLGGVSAGLVRSSPTSVLVVPRPGA